MMTSAYKMERERERKRKKSTLTNLRVRGRTVCRYIPHAKCVHVWVCLIVMSLTDCSCVIILNMCRVQYLNNGPISFLCSRYSIITMLMMCYFTILFHKKAQSIMGIVYLLGYIVKTLPYTLLIQTLTKTLIYIVSYSHSSDLFFILHFVSCSVLPV